MVTSVNGGAGAVSLLNFALSQPKPGEFKPKTSAVTNIQTTLGQSDFQANQRLIYSSALNRLEGIRQGIVEPNPNNEWEVVGAYLSQTGQPFKLQIGSDGRLNVEAQAESSLNGYSQAQKMGIMSAIQQFDEIAQQVDFESTKKSMLSKFDYAYVKLVGMENYFPPEEQWEKDFQLYKNMGQPVQISLNADGELIALNQLQHDFSDVEDDDDRAKLLRARDDLNNILAGRKTASESWHYLALGNKTDGDDYLITLNDAGEIEIRNNMHRSKPTADKNLDHIVPKFLKEDSEIKYTSDWQEQAANLYRQQKPFYFDFDNSGTKLVAREIDLIHAMGLHKPVDRSDLIIQAQVSMLI